MGVNAEAWQIYVTCLPYLSPAYFLRWCFTEPGTRWGWPANSFRNLLVSEPQCSAYKCRPLCYWFCMDAGYQHLGPHVSFFAHEVNVKWLSINYMPHLPIFRTALYPYLPHSLHDGCCWFLAFNLNSAVNFLCRKEVSIFQRAWFSVLHSHWASPPHSELPSTPTLSSCFSNLIFPLPRYMLLTAEDSLYVNCNFALHLNLAVEIVAEAKESTGCQFLHAFPSQSSLGFHHSHHRSLVAFVTLPWTHTSLFCREQQISALFSGAAASTPFFCLAKRKKKVTFPKKKKSIGQEYFLFLFALHCEFATLSIY